MDEHLPAICHNLAARKKGESKKMTLQQAFDMTREELKLGHPPASPSHVIDLETHDFFGNAMESLGAGLLPCSIIPPDAPSKEAQKAIIEDQEQSRQHDMSSESVQGALLATDAKKLYNAKGCLAREWPEAEIQLELCAVMLGTILGTQHATVQAYLEGLNRYKAMRIKLHASMDKEFGPRLAPALLVFYFQLNMRSWLEERWRFGDETNGVPDFMTGFREFTWGLRLTWLPNHTTIPTLAALAASPTPAAPSGDTGTRSTPGPAAAPVITQENRVQNARRDPRHTGNTPLAVNIRTRSIRDAIRLAGRDPPMVTRNGTATPMCLSWHLKGTCSNACARRADHVANSDAERDALCDWCQPAFA